ncbi:MAG: lysophospholipid acyltransferase family protein [Gemmatimonadota bacterium]
MTTGIRKSRVRPVPPDVPARRSLMRRVVGLLGLTLFRWRVRGEVPNIPKMVMAVAPHTSNWDFVIAFFVYLGLQIHANWLGKHTLFRWPFGPIFRYFGGIPINRGRSRNVVEDQVAAFVKRDKMVLVVAPEGTRKRSHWKRGFYHIARGAGVPILPAAIDFSRREVVFGDPILLTGDYEADLARIGSHFNASMARHPNQFVPATEDGGREGSRTPHAAGARAAAATRRT